MSAKPMLNDTDLVAYVDGRLPADQTRAIASAAKTDAALAHRIGALAAGTPDLGDLWADMLQSAPKGLLPASVDQPVVSINRRAWFLGVGSAVFGLAAGFGLRSFYSAPQADWETAVAEYHMLYGASTVRALTPNAAAQAAEIAAVETATGLTVPALDVEGLAYRRAQMLDLRGKQIVHIVLTTAEVVPIAFCLSPENGPIRQPEYRLVGDMGLVTWASGSAASLLVARLPSATLLALADRLYA